MTKIIPNLISKLSVSKRTVALTATGLLATAAVGTAAVQITSSNVSATIPQASPTTQVVGTPSGSTPGSSTSTGQHRRTLLNRAVHGSVEIYSHKTGQLVTITLDRGKLVSATSSAITISELGVGNVTINLAPTTRFLGLTEAQLEADPSARVFLVSRDGTLWAVHSRVITASPTSTGSAAA